MNNKNKQDSIKKTAIDSENSGRKKKRSAKNHITPELFFSENCCFRNKIDNFSLNSEIDTKFIQMLLITDMNSGSGE